MSDALPSAAPGTPPRAPLARAPPDDGETSGILVVDDREANLKALCALLGDVGERLVAARSGSEALRRMLEHDFSLVLLDVRMPILDGYETARLVRARDRSRDTPILFLTAARLEDEEVSRGYALGDADYVPKPVVPEMLLAKVRTMLDLHRARRRARRARAEVRRLASVAAACVEAGPDSPRASCVLRRLGSYAVLRARDDGAGTRVDSANALEAALEDLRERVEAVAGEVTHGPLPALAADPAEVRHLFRCLVEDALWLHGGRGARVHVGCTETRDERGEAPAFVVRFGMPPALGPEDASLRLPPASGIDGLVTCREIVTRAGGRLTIELEGCGRGAFRFSVPSWRT